MKITLRIDGQDKKFINDFVKARTFKRALELNKKFIEELNPGEIETFDAIIEFVAFAFDNQFTSDDVWDGLSASQVQSEPMRIFEEVLNLGGLVTGPLQSVSEGDTEGK